MDYKGWKNLDTWKVFTLLTNDKDCFFSASRCGTTEELKETFLAYFDVNEVAFDAVNWDEVFNELT